MIQSYEKWIENYYTMRNNILGPMISSYPLLVIFGYLHYHKVLRTLHGQGTARYTSEERAAKRLEIWEGMNALVVEARTKQKAQLQAQAQAQNRDDDEYDDQVAAGGPIWLGGDKGPTEADATLFGFLASSLICDA